MGGLQLYRGPAHRRSFLPDLGGFSVNQGPADPNMGRLQGDGMTTDSSHAESES